MKDDEQVVFSRNGDAFAEALHADHAFADEIGERGFDRAEEERRREPDLFDRLADDALPQRLDIDGDVRKLGHGLEG